MPLVKQQKEKILENLKEMFSRQKAIVLIGITGLKVKDITELRNEIKEIGGNLKVAKKTLMEIAFKENNLEFDKNKFKEEVALVFGFEDEVSPARTVYKFSKKSKNLKILGGYLEGSFKEIEDVVALAQLPSKNELMARLVGGIRSPISNFVSVLGGNIKGLLCVLNRIKT